jgi:hypothetical protein
MPELRSMLGSSTRDRPKITSVSEYRGERAVAIAATQLGTDYTRAQASRVVAEWVEFFSSGPTPITELHFVSRTPERLFAALRNQVQLQRLFVKWGDYDELGSLQGMRSLEVLRLGGASSVHDLSPVQHLDTLISMEIESLRYARDLSPLGQLSGLRHLAIGGDWQSPRIAHVDSIDWLPRLTSLEQLLMHSVIVDDRDYSPLLLLPALKAVRVMATRGMQPPIEALRERLPWAD